MCHHSTNANSKGFHKVGRYIVKLSDNSSLLSSGLSPKFMSGSAQTHSLVLHINHHCLTTSLSKLLLLANNSGGGTSDSYDNIAGAEDDNWASGKPKSRFSQLLICLLIIKVYFISRG